jgi:hypothetical protein
MALAALEYDIARVREALAKRQPPKIGGKACSLTLAHADAGLVRGQVLLTLNARRGRENLFCEVLLNRQRLTDSDLIAALLIETARRLLTGKLPPGSQVVV